MILIGQNSIGELGQVRAVCGSCFSTGEAQLVLANYRNIDCDLALANDVGEYVRFSLFFSLSLSPPNILTSLTYP